MDEVTCSVDGCDRTNQTTRIVKGMCFMHYKRVWRHGDPNAYFRTGHGSGIPTVMERFWELVDKNGPVPPHNPTLGQCWVWTGTLIKSGWAKGYASLRVGKRPMRVHQYSYLLTKGAVPEGLEIDHHCRTRNCVNPDHLEAVTHLENMRRSIRCKANAHLLEFEPR